MITAETAQTASFCTKNNGEIFVLLEAAYVGFSVTRKTGDEKPIFLELFDGAIDHVDGICSPESGPHFGRAQSQKIGAGLRDFQ